MKTLALAAISTATLFAALSVPASALPSLPSIPSIDKTAVELVGWRCGPHRHWNWRWHRCVRNW